MKTSMKSQILSASLISMLLFFAAQVSAHESYSLKGRVLNNKTESIKGAVVRLVNPETFEIVAEGRCKENGEFSIDSVPEGEYNLVVKKNGTFRAKVKRIIIDDNGKYMVTNVHANDSTQTPNDFVASR